MLEVEKFAKPNFPNILKNSTSNFVVRPKLVTSLLHPSANSKTRQLIRARATRWQNFVGAPWPAVPPWRESAAVQPGAAAALAFRFLIKELPDSAGGVSESGPSATFGDNVALPQHPPPLLHCGSLSCRRTAVSRRKRKEPLRVPSRSTRPARRQCTRSCLRLTEMLRKARVRCGLTKRSAILSGVEGTAVQSSYYEIRTAKSGSRMFNFFFVFRTCHFAPFNSLRIGRQHVIETSNVT